MGDFSPKIVLFTCQNCPSQAKDRMLYMKAQNPFNGVSVVKLPCLSRLDVHHVLKVFEEGADGVLVVGCSDDSCLYKEGVKLAEKRITYLKEILENTGLEEKRVQLIQASSSRAHIFSSEVKEGIALIQELGPAFE